MNKILLVEDNANQRLLYEEELVADGLDLISARDGWEAMMVMREHDFDLVVLDIHLPGMDGIDAMSRMLAKKPDLPIIIHTAYSAFKANFLTWAAEAYVVKSSDLRELKSAIARVLATR